MKPLAFGTEYSSDKLQLSSAGKDLVLCQEVCDDVEWRKSEIWLTFGADGGKTWSGKAVYKAGSLLDPAIAFARDGSLVMAGSSRTGDESRPWVVRSRVER